VSSSGRLLKRRCSSEEHARIDGDNDLFFCLDCSTLSASLCQVRAMSIRMDCILKFNARSAIRWHAGSFRVRDLHGGQSVNLLRHAFDSHRDKIEQNLSYPSSYPSRFGWALANSEGQPHAYHADEHIER
jgi:hypothetical protein